MNCDQCGSDNLRSYRMIYEEGRFTSTGTVRGVGAGVSLGGGVGVGVGAAKTSGVTISDLSQRVAPPVLKDAGVESGLLATFALAGLAFVVLAFKVKVFLWAVIATAAIVVIGFSMTMVFSSSGASDKHRAAMARWSRSFLCMQCGATKVAPDR